MMKICFLFITLFITSVNVLYGQHPTDFKNAVDKDKMPGEFTCGVYSYNPHVEGEFFIIDFYGRCFSDEAWKAIYSAKGKKYDVSNLIGSFAVSFVKNGSEPDFNKKFSEVTIELNPIFTQSYTEEETGELISSCRLKPLDKFDLQGSTNQFVVIYVPDSEQFSSVVDVKDSFDDRIVIDVPFYLCTFKFKILPEAKNLKSGFYLKAGGTSVGVWDLQLEQTNNKASTACNVVGWLDGIDPGDIPLQETAPSTKPEDPVFASDGDKTVCPGLSGRYAIGAAKNATGYDWWISATDKGSDINNSAIGVVTLNGDGLGASVAWGTAAAGKTYYVCVQAKNNAGETSAVVSYAVTIPALPNVVIAASSNGTNVVGSAQICGKSPLTLAVTPENDVTYTWTGTGLTTGVAGATQNIASLVNPSDPKSETYTVKATSKAGCEATANITLTVNPTPEALNLTPPLINSYSSGTLLTISDVNVSAGGPLSFYDWKITYDNGSAPITKTGADKTIGFTVQKTTTTVNLTAKNDYNCSATMNPLVITASAGGIDKLEIKPLFDGTMLCSAGGVLPIKATVTGLSTGSNYTYSWYDGKTTAGTLLKTESSTSAENIYTATKVGFYTVKVAVNSLEATATFEVKASSSSATPVIVKPELIAAAPDRTVVLWAQAGGSGSFSYNWEPVAKIKSGEAGLQYPLTQPITETTAFQVYMKNAANCVSTDTTNVRLPGGPDEPGAGGSGDSAEKDMQLAVTPKTASLCLGNKLMLKAEVTGNTTGQTPTYAWLRVEGNNTTGLTNYNTATPTLTASNAGAGTHTYFVTVTVGSKVMTARMTVNINANSAPTFTTPTPIFCAGDLLTIPSGSTASSYDWWITKNGNTTQTTASTVTLPDAGIYTVKVVGKSGSCVSDTAVINSMEIKKPELVQTLDISPMNTYLLGQDIVATATASNGWGNYTYSWTSPLPKKENTTDNTYTVSGASADQYDFIVSVKDEKGCPATAATLTARKAAGGLELAVDTMHAYCTNGMAMLQAKASGGVPGAGYKYEWTLVGSASAILSTESTYLVKNPDASASYQVKVTDNSSPALTRTATILLSDKKSSNTAPNLTTPGTITIHPNTSAILSAVSTPAATNKFRWNWSPADGFTDQTQRSKQYATTAQLSADKGYQVYAIDGNGCISTEKPLQVEVKDAANNGFMLAVVATESMCATSRQTLSATFTPEQPATDFAYEWTSVPAGLFTAATQTLAQPDITPSTAGSYLIALTATHKTSGKKNTAIKTIEVKGDAVPVLELSLNSTACVGDTVTVTVAPGVSVNDGYTWYVDNVLQSGVTGDKFALENMTGSKTVRVEATGTNGCVAEKEVRTTISPQPNIEWNPTLPPTINVTETLIATAQPVGGTVGNYTWSWKVTPVGTPATNSYTVVTKVGDKQIDLQVTATEKTGGKCKKTLTWKTLVTGAELEMDVELDGLACVGGSAVMVVKNINNVGPFTYAWTASSDPNTVIGTDSILIKPIASGTPITYKVTVSKADGKKGFGEIVVTGVTGKTVPTVAACADITIPVNTKAVLTADANGTQPFAWTWRAAKDLQALNEASLQSPTTRELSGTTTYNVRVKDASGCVSMEDELKVLIDGNKALKVEIVPDMQLCKNNHVRYRAIVTDKNGAAVTVTQSQWKAMEGITPVNGDLLAADYTANKARLDTIVVVVYDATRDITATAKKVVTIQSFEVPALEFDKEVSCAGDVLTVKTNKTGPQEALKGDYTWFVSKNGGSLSQPTGGTYTFADAGTYSVRVVAKTEHCTMDTLRKEITIAPIPVITVNVDSICGRAKLVAITQYADQRIWTSKGVISGIVDEMSDSIYYYKTNVMSQDFTGTVIAKNSIAGCQSAPVNYNGTVYALPNITMVPKKQSVYPTTEVEIEAQLDWVLPYKLTWNNADLLAAGQGTNKIKTIPLSIADYQFVIEVANTANTNCKISDTSNIAVDNKNFLVSFGAKEMDVCQNVEVAFAVEAINNKYDPISYTYTSDDPEFNITDKTDKFKYTFKKVGEYRVYVEAINSNTPAPDVRRDTVVVRVNPTPTLSMDLEAGKRYFLCEKKGELKINFTATGAADWKLYYKLGTNRMENLTQSPHQMKLTEGGTFAVDSIVDNKGCKFVPSRMGFTVEDDIPRIELTSTDDYKKCQGETTDLNLKISNTQALDYPMNLYYWVDMSEEKFIYTDAATKFASTQKGTYTVDSIVSNRGCVFRLKDQNQVTVAEYAEAVPVLALTDKSAKTFCEGGSVDIPVTITTGKPSYTISYTMNGASKTATLGASDNRITLTENGPFVLKSFKDANGCGTFPLDETIPVTMNVKPAMEIVSSGNTQICGGQLDLGLKLSKGTAPYTITYTVDGGAEQTKTISTVAADKSAVWNITKEGAYSISKVTDQYCEIPGTDVTGEGQNFTVTPLRLYVKLKSNADVCATSAAKIELDFTGTTWPDVKGKVRVTYEFVPTGGGTAETKTIDFEQSVAQGTPAITPVPQGTYTLKSVSDLGNSGCEGVMSGVESDNKITVIEAPVVEIDSLDFALNKGASFVLGVKGPDDLKLKFDYAWQQDGSGFTPVSKPFTVNGTMADKDMVYVLKGTNKTTPTCYNTDTVHIYKIPDAPSIAIDTNKTRYDLVLKYDRKNVLDQIDGYRIMQNRWDGYALESAYKPKVNNTPSVTYELPASGLDTLEFFYVQAIRKVKIEKVEKTYYSAASDTVGYYKCNVELNTTPGLSSNNLVPVYFDFKGMGIVNAGDLFKRINTKPIEFVGYIRQFNYTTQVWDFARQTPTGLVTQSFNISQYSVLQFAAEKKPTVFIQYGILPAITDFNVYNIHTDKTNNNLLFLQPSKMNQSLTKDIFTDHPTLEFIRKWNFKTQTWDFARKLGSGNIANDFKLRPILMPLQFAPKVGSSSIIWKGR